MQLQKSQIILKYQKRLEELLKKYKTLKDIIIFGSAVKGKINPRDIDFALLIIDDSELDIIKKELKEIEKNADIEIITLDSIHNPIWITLIREGFSIKKNKYLFEIYNLTPCVLYKYNLKKLTPIKKVQFTRGLKILLKDTDSKMLSRSIVLVPMIHKKNMDSLLDRWEIKYESKSYELFPILRKEEFI